MAAIGDGSKAKAVKKSSGDCPWCNFDNKDERIAEVHEKCESTLTQTLDGDYQCNTCGKHWKKTDLGKDWSIALERGPQWEREDRGRQLRGF